MWIKDLQIALETLFAVYGNLCCVSSIKDSTIIMTNGDRWDIINNSIIFRK